MSPRPTLGDRIKLKLKALGYWKNGRADVRRFCAEKGYPPQYVYAWLNGRTPSAENLERLSQDLGVSAAWLMFGDESSLHPQARAAAVGDIRPATRPETKAPRQPSRTQLAGHSTIPPSETGEAQSTPRIVEFAHFRELKDLAERLVAKEAEIRAAFSAFPDLYVWLGRDAKILDYQAGEGFDLAAVPVSIGKRFPDLLPPDVRRRCSEAIGEVIQTGAPATLEYSAVGGKTEQAFEVRLQPLRQKNVLALIRDISHLRLTERALSETETRLNLVLEHLPLVLYSRKLAGGAIWMSAGVERLSGFPAVQFGDDSSFWASRLHGDDRERVLEQFRALVTSGTPFTCEYRWRCADGTYRWFWSHATAVRTPKNDSEEILGAWMDVTERVRAEGAAKALAEVSHELVATLDLSRVADRIVSAVLRLLDSTRSALFQLVPESEELVCVAVAGVGDSGKWIGRRLPRDSTLAGRAAWEHRPAWSSDTLTDPRLRLPAWLRERIAEEGSRAVAVVPLIGRGEVLGSLAVGDSAGRVFTDQEIGLLSAFADQAALALGNARLYEEARRQRQEAEALADLTRTINAALDLDTVLQRVVDAARALCQSDIATVALLEPESGALVVGQRVGTRYDGYDSLRIEPGKGAGGLVLLTGRPFRTACYADDPRITKDYIEPAGAEGIVASLAVPVRFRDRTEGVLYLGNRSPRPFTDRDEQILLRLADHAAVAIENAILFREAEQERRRAESLAELGRLVSESLDPQEVAQRVVKSIRELLDVRGALVGRLISEPNHLEVVASSGEVEWADGTRWASPPGTGAVGYALATRQPLTTPDIRTDSRFARTTPLPFKCHARLVVPLVLQGRTIGALMVGDSTGRVFTDKETRLAQAFADQAAVALENARLYAELKAASKAQ